MAGAFFELRSRRTPSFEEIVKEAVARSYAVDYKEDLETTETFLRILSQSGTGALLRPFLPRPTHGKRPLKMYSS